ncbi:MAG: 4Fe-4S dicluster domain-containing protein [Myxococcales bacterium]|nr:4Fe-4S dicluster domain-containing protein [Myxococcales bacterium]
MTVAEWPLVGGVYDDVGRATRALKEHLKRLGVDVGAIRRALIAAYEAEANVVIHARRGTMRCYFGPGQLDVEVEDEGPGIPDIDLALREGFSTAPLAARELGFGAGMGLPSIRRNSDRFSLQSTVGRGTRVAFSVRYRPQEGGVVVGHSVAVEAARCQRCRRCVRACPVQAVRLRDSGPSILEHLCIDCAACLAVCPTGALGLRGRSDAPAVDGGTLVVPDALLVQFGAAVRPADALAALERLGHRDVRTLEPWERGLRAAAAERARANSGPRPVIAPFCPAVLNLVASRFPGLLAQVAPFLTPLEAARRALQTRPAAFVTLCPAQRSSLTSTTGPGAAELVAPTSLLREMLGVLVGRPRPTVDEAASPVAAPTTAPAVLVATGLRHVLRVLDEAENGALGDVLLLELWACDGGCFGSPLLREDPAIAGHRARTWSVGDGPVAPAEPLAVERQVRRGVRLDPDLSRAVQLLGEIDRLARALPGRDCADCGAPTCQALAEDVVLGRAMLAACPHRPVEEELR